MEVGNICYTGTVWRSTVCLFHTAILSISQGLNGKLLADGADGLLHVQYYSKIANCPATRQIQASIGTKTLPGYIIDQAH